MRVASIDIRKIDNLVIKHLSGINYVENNPKPNEKNISCPDANPVDK